VADVLCPKPGMVVGDMPRYARGFDWTLDIMRLSKRELFPIYLAISIGMPSSIVLFKATYIYLIKFLSNM
jgi:hypothetical protein